MFELPASDVANCINPTKNDVEVQLHEHDTVGLHDDCVVDIRMYVPPKEGESEEKEEDAKTGAEVGLCFVGVPPPWPVCVALTPLP